MARRERLICTSAALVDGGTGVRFDIERSGARLPAFAIRYRGMVHAYVNECRHQATELDWNPGEFFDAERLYLICATHGALASVRAGPRWRAARSPGVPSFPRPCSILAAIDSTLALVDCDGGKASAAARSVDAHACVGLVERAVRSANQV